ncbi:hypothetical protein K2173_020949 [Erythroxylum novogranatense]|uniref:GIR1-like zinc ribbon domain-containing protein n=1 Tax=Erythroxylum novogranatense TaxID=1862640 RepID=A0AAV8TPD4_9ROSI|nr:hypothetical protein K2173_020949 [Erythroxylum novogranatense]
MSRKVNSPKLDLKLNLSQPTMANSQNKSDSCCEMASPEIDQRSCVSSEEEETMKYKMGASSETTSTAMNMMLVGCPRCLMYIMLPEADPRCPICKNTPMLLDFLNQANTKKTAI